MRSGTAASNFQDYAPNFNMTGKDLISYIAAGCVLAFTHVASAALLNPGGVTPREFPPRRKPGSFSIDQVMESMQAAAKGGAN